MIRRNLAVKVGLAIMALIVAVSIVQYIALGQLLKNAFYQQAGTELVAEGQQYAHMSAMGGTMMMQMLCASAGATMVMVDSSGSVIASSPSLHLNNPSSSDKSVIQAALAGRTSLHGGVSQLFHGTGLVAAVPIQTSRLIGAVVLFRSETTMVSAFHHVEWLLLVAGLGGMVIALGLTVIVSKRIVHPLQEMYRVARDMTKGNYQAEVRVAGQDEVAKLGEAINALAANLHHLDTSRKAFLADVAHELRTPMSYIRGYSQVVDEGLFNTEEEKQHYIRIIHDESKRLESLVSDLFVLAQGDTGMLVLDKHPVDVGQLISSVVERMRKKAEDKGIDVEISSSGDINLMADGVRLEQVLVNLLDNAIRYTPAQGHIGLRAQKSLQFVELAVSDTGVGIPKDDLPHIFDRMYRVEKSRSRARGGAGLGLAIVKQIVEAHGGTVAAQSEENRGTTITMRIPSVQG
ncbi:HAMP domain-containing histidine kinase [Alicyclobacillus curvatus]|nr:HAMP domain-containing histidine kinase [Alicyclobacillus curvatus]